MVAGPRKCETTLTRLETRGTVLAAVEIIRLIVALPQPLLVHGILRVAEQVGGIAIVGCASTLASFRALVSREAADVVLVDATWREHVELHGVNAHVLPFGGPLGLPATCSAEELVNAVRQGQPHQTVAAALTERERDVLRLAAQGLSVSAIAQRLYISSATVKTHLHHSYGKLGVTNRAGAVAKALQMCSLD